MCRFLTPLLVLFAGLASAADAPRIANFHQVDSGIYRGAQPDREDLVALARMGVKTVLDLRDGAAHARAEDKWAKAAGLRYISLPMDGLRAPTKEQIARALNVLTDAANGPVFVHCRRGSDRTGTVVACYRVAHDQWPNQKALDEARSFGMSWLETGMRSYVLNYRPLPSAQ